MLVFPITAGFLYTLLVAGFFNNLRLAQSSENNLFLIANSFALLFVLAVIAAVLVIECAGPQE
jgi:type IV secretory pathway VirB3-like protein